jgi:hypothetical protein
MKAHFVSRCLKGDKASSYWRAFRWGSGKTFGLMVVMTLLASAMLSGCATTSSAGAASSNASSFNAADGSAANGNAGAVSTTPGAVQFTAGSRDVTLNWNSSISTGVIGYNVYRGAGSGGPYMRLNSSILPATNYTDNAVQRGQTYYYVVTAINSGNIESDYSKEVTAPIP